MSRHIPESFALTRRELVSNLALAIAAGAVTALPPRVCRAAPPSRLDPKDPAAVAVGYTEQAGNVDTKKYPSFVKGSTCENCLLLQGAAGAGYRPCDLFPGKLVSAGGWCSGWTAEI
jgi:hypothetical protein